MLDGHLKGEKRRVVPEFPLIRRRSGEVKPRVLLLKLKDHSSYDGEFQRAIFMNVSGLQDIEMHAFLMDLGSHLKSLPCRFASRGSFREHSSAGKAGNKKDEEERFHKELFGTRAENLSTVRICLSMSSIEYCVRLVHHKNWRCSYGRHPLNPFSVPLAQAQRK